MRLSREHNGKRGNNTELLQIFYEIDDDSAPRPHTIVLIFLSSQLNGCVFEHPFERLASFSPTRAGFPNKALQNNCYEDPFF
jgi:hypothetical protein